MKIKQTKIVFPFLFIALMFFGAKTASASNAPVIFYTDITSGPNTGGENNNGAVVSIFGKNFGSGLDNIQVYIGNNQVARKVYLGPSLGRTDIQQLAVQIGPSVNSGNIKVVVNGEESNTGLNFTVRSGNIYFVAPAGDDAAAGSYTAPWEHLDVAKSRLYPGDILYALDGLECFTQDRYSSSDECLRITTSGGSARDGTEANPIAMIVYPGETAQIGCTDEGCPKKAISGYLDWWTIAGFTMRSLAGGRGAAISYSDYLNAMEGSRLVNNNLRGAYYSIGTFSNSNMFVLGNNMIGSVTGNSIFYFSGSSKYPSDYIEIGWNLAHDCIGDDGYPIKFFYAPPSGPITPDALPVDKITIHDNAIYTTDRAPILLGGNDWGDNDWLYDIKVYNNIIYDFRGGAGEGAIRYSNTSGDLEVHMNVETYNNTIILDADSSRSCFEVNGGNILTFKNNLCVMGNTAISYFARIENVQTSIAMDHNGYYGGISIPAYDANPISGNPLFINANLHDYRLMSNSPYVNTGVSAGITRDYNGLSRPQGSGYDIGAFEYDENTPIDTIAPSAPGGLSVR